MSILSVIMATLNAEKYLQQTLNSLALQSFKDFEIIVVDGGSTDLTVSIAQSFPNLRILVQKTKGLTGAWNEGILASQSPLIAFLDSDDYWVTNCLELHIEQFQRNENLLGSIGKVEFFLDDSTLPIPKHFKPSLLNGNHVGYMPGCFLGRRSLFNTLGLFDESLAITSDIAWFALLKQSIKDIAVVDQTVLYKRVHSNNLSYKAAESSAYQTELLHLLNISINARNA